jgi:energy-coupling factor transport system substrate-specific component
MEMSKKKNYNNPWSLKFNTAALVLISTPLNMIFWGGTTGNVWGDAAYAVCLANGLSAWVASTVDEIIVDLPDKIVTILIVMGMYKSMPKGLLSLYQSNGRIESLD